MAELLDFTKPYVLQHMAAQRIGVDKIEPALMGAGAFVVLHRHGIYQESR